MDGLRAGHRGRDDRNTATLAAIAAEVDVEAAVERGKELSAEEAVGLARGVLADALR